MILQHGNPKYPIRHEGILAASLLALALFNMPYGYYQFLRWVIMVIGISIAFEQIAQQQRWLFFFGLSVAGLFNPFLKVSFDRQTWWYIDLGLAAYFLLIGLTVRDGTKDQNEDDFVEFSLDEHMRADQKAERDL